MRWRIGSAPSLLNALDDRAPGAPAWDVELFRARGMPPGRWTIAHEGHPPEYYFDGAREADRFRLVAGAGDRALGEDRRLRA